MLKLELDKVKCKLLDVNPRAEVHGDEKKIAADLKITCDVSNDFLPLFHPNLKGMLYHYDEAVQGDLADQGKRHEAGFTPHLRMPPLGVLDWDEELLGAKVTIHYGVGGRSDIVLDTSNVNNFKIAPKQGGTVQLTFRVQAHPDEKQVGKLCTMIQQEIDVSLDPHLQPPLSGE